ncbi:MAG: serine hydrolase, partial [Pseudomonadota bacterium]
MTIINRHTYQQFTVPFAMASLLAVMPCAAEASAAKGPNPNTTHCTYTPPLPSDKKWTWASADIKARLVPIPKNSYAVDVVGQPINAEAKLPIASLTKNMTAYLVFEAIKTGHLKPTQKIPIAPAHFCLSDNDFATRYLPVGIRDITVADALTLLLHQSNNTMALALADAVAGNEVQFVEKMNRNAASWGMKNTHFMNPNGLPVGNRKNEYITAKD